MTKKGLLTSMLFMVVLAAVAAIVPPIIGSKPTLGLDLQGGFSVVLQAKEVDGQLPSEASVERAKEIIRQRVDGLGVAEPDITRQGRTVVVQLPGLTNREKAESVIGCTARLEFRPVLNVKENTALVTKVTTPESGATTAPGQTTVTTTAGATTAPAQPTTTIASGGAGGDEEGMGTVGVAPGEGALPVQFKPSTTTTAPPETTVPETTVPETTAPETTVPATSTTAGEPTSTTVPAEGGSGSSCGQADVPIDENAFGGAAGTIMPSESGEQVYLLGPSAVSGEALSSAEASLVQGRWLVNADIRSNQRVKANDMFNSCNAGLPTCPTKLLAIVLDGQVLSAPEVQSANLADEQFQISGDFSEADAKDLALVLRYGSLPVVFEQAALQQVSATLGSDSLRAGLIAGFVGIFILAVYMVLYYRGFGMTVVVSLLVWMALMYGLVCLLSETQGLALTLAGITGIIVSVGTTVDTYVVVFERIKDEIREGRSVRVATERGYESGIKTVFTANGAAFIGAFLLWWLTVGPVRGFAYFLGLSVILDLAVAVLFTRPLILLLGRSNAFANARFFGIGTATDQQGSKRARRAAPRGGDTPLVGDDVEGGDR